MKKILIVPSFPIWPLYGNEIDLIKQLSEEKNFIKVLNCKKTPQYCAANTFKFKNDDIKNVLEFLFFFNKT